MGRGRSGVAATRHQPLLLIEARFG